MGAIVRGVVGFSLVASFLAAGCGGRAEEPEPYCGDGKLDPGELCDDGVRNSDTLPGACRTHCAPASCGDGVVDPGEECDDGPDNSDWRPGACRESCVLSSCGDGVVDPGEGCDEGPRNGEPGACKATCALSTCGDGVLDPGEECDDGEENDDAAPGACRTTCLRAHCGDGVLDEGEECDDGRNNSDTRADACRTTCRPATCGDGFRDTGEECDNGVLNSDTVPNACRTDCRKARCGDGVVDAGEGCDDGPDNGKGLPDGCRVHCIAPSCGDGVVDTGEECDDGAGNDDHAQEACRTTCRLPHCGDGVVGPDEECDQGLENSDTAPGACRTNCRLPHCGDGIVDPWEQCDEGPGNRNAPDTCRRDCRFPRCGDGILDTGEECDDGASGLKDGCTDGCLVSMPDTCLDRKVPLQDLRVVGTAAGQGFVVSPRLPEGYGEVSASCGGSGKEALYAYVAPASGDLLVELEYPWDGPSPVLAIRRSCADGDPWELSCVRGYSGTSPARLVVPDVSPAQGAYYVHVDKFSSVGDGLDYTLRVQLLPWLEAGASCAVDGSSGRCDPDRLACADPDGDGDGTCVLLRDEGSPCDPEGAADRCREPLSCRDGTCAPSCGDGIQQPWEACDDGNDVENDGCTSECRPSPWSCDAPADLAAAWDPEAKRVRWIGDTEGLVDHVWGPCGASPHRDAVATFAAPESGRYAFSLVDSPGQLLAILDRCARRDAVALACLRSAPSLDELELEKGEQVVLVVDSWGSGTSFEVVVERVTCGDGAVQGTEECDDGNGVDDDACRNDCTLPGEHCGSPMPLEPVPGSPSITWSGLFSVYADDDFSPTCGTGDTGDAVAVFTAPASGRYSFSRREGARHVDFFLSVRLEDCEEGREAGCALVIGDGPPVGIEVVLEEGEKAWVIVDALSYIPGFSVTAGALVCGDGHRVWPEECDDGNLADGDGCDSACRVEPVAEVEPNDIRSQAQPLAVGRVLGGSLKPGDFDYVSLELVENTAYEFEIFLGGWERCETTSPSAIFLRLHGANGEALAADAYGGIDFCPRLSFTAPATGTYYLVVEETPGGSAHSAVPDYLLRVDAPPPAAAGAGAPAAPAPSSAAPEADQPLPAGAEP